MSGNGLELAVHPLTGEQVQLATAPDGDLARFLSDVRDYESRLKEAKSLVTRELLGRMDRDASYTLRTDGWELRGQSPKPGEEFDEVALLGDLWGLVDEGVISEKAIENAIQSVTTFKVNAAGISALRKLGGRVKETVDRHAREVEKKRYVSVKPLGGDR